MKYEYFKRRSYSPDNFTEDLITSDIFISAFNTSDRVKTVFDLVKSKNKYWIIFPEYDISTDELPDNTYFQCPEKSEDMQLVSFFENLELDIAGTSIAVDITGFPRPQLAFLIKFMKYKEVATVEFLYSEPMQYKKKEITEFSIGSLREVRQIKGYEGNHNPYTHNDHLIIGSGFDSKQIKSVCNSKEHATIHQLIGFPSLRPDMYQQNILKTAQASENLGERAIREPIFAPANDPFITATVLSSFCKENDLLNNDSNLYFSPLSTKTQTLGFILFFLFELENTACSLIFPFFSNYEKETSIGLHRINYYRVNLDI